jgi:uncharacterized protein YbjT (DUF2867 family)
MTTLIIFGATGLVGSQALALALADKRVAQVIAPTRRALPHHERLANPRLEQMLQDADTDLWRADGAICALGTTRKQAGSAAAFRAIDHDLVLQVAERCRQAGVPRFALVSSLGADPRARFLYPRTKGEVERAVEQLGFPSLAILRPGFLEGHRQEQRPMEKMMGMLLRVAAPLLPRSARASGSALVAAALVDAAIQQPAGTQIISSERFASSKQ